MSAIALSTLLLLSGAGSPEDIYNAYRVKVASLQSVTGTIIRESGGKQYRHEFGMEKPGKFFVWSDTQAFICDGKQVWQYMPGTKQFNQPPFEHYGKGPLLNPFLPFIDGDKALRAKELKMGDFDGKQVLLAIDRPNGQVSLTSVIDPQSLLPLAHIQNIANNDSTCKYTDIRENVDIDESRFALPSDAKPMESNTGDEKLLPVGGTAPDFTLTTPSGGKVELKKELKGAKLLWLNFWFYGCGPCQEELPKLDETQASLRGKGLRVITVNEGDPADLITKFLKEKSYSFQVGMNGKGADVVKQYGVKAFPTNYLISPEGKIVARFTGFKESEIRKELAKAGIQ